jgi:transcriptional regulator with XRE-family HTH domain
MKFKPEIFQLAALRQSRGLSLETIADRTKISIYYLRAIEDWDLAKLPGGVYRDSFLKQYAEAIDTDLAQDLSAKLAKEAHEAAQANAQAAATDSFLRTVKETLARGAALLFLFTQAHSSISAEGIPPKQESVRKDDPRYQALRNFFDRYRCPVKDLAPDFIDAADKNGLDWRLLPSIVFLESGGGKNAPQKNLMGWNSGKAKFQTARQGIHYVAERLARSPIYAGKDLRTKLRIYNPARKDYAQKVFAVMEQMTPTPSIAAAR